MLDRRLHWDGCVNVRDLGGLRLIRGGETRPGAVVRADSLTRLTRAGWESALGYRVRRIVDLRADDELNGPWPDGVSVTRVPILPGSYADPLWPEFTAIFEAAGDDERGLRDVYLEFLERWPESFAAGVAAIAASGAGVTVVQCGAGRDRTGLVVALLLDAAGVEPMQIALDDAMTPPIDGAPGATAWVMGEVLDALREKHGGGCGYLTAAGLPDEVLEAAVARIR
ncbi:MAG: tyrosine-protein phosphatase [Gaiellales bacterium]